MKKLQPVDFEIVQFLLEIAGPRRGFRSNDRRNSLI